MTNFVCIVDAYSTGKYLAKAFKELGYKCIHIKSSSKLPDRFQHKTEDFITSLEFDGDINGLKSDLQAFGNIAFCIPGYESGVELADELSEKLCTPSNGSISSKLRRNKYEMNEAVRQAGLATVLHKKSHDCDDIVAWAKEQNLSASNPIILKPLESANGDNVFFCHDERELREAFAKITRSKNQFGEENSEVLAETLNAGTEYIINSVSCDGRHYVAEMWRIIRKPSTTIYDKAVLLTPHDEEWAPITNYTIGVLNALKIQYGAGTTELKYTSEKGPILLETSSRLMGGANLTFAEEIASFSQLSLLVESYHQSQKFLERLNHPRPPLKKYGMDVLLISTHQGILNVDINDELKQIGLESLHSSKCLGKGDNLMVTTHQDSTPGEIFLMADNTEALERDYRKIRAWEKTFYNQAVYINQPAKQSDLLIS